jgi:hypothetical protein
MCADPEGHGRSRRAIQRTMQYWFSENVSQIAAIADVFWHHLDGLYPQMI